MTDLSTIPTLPPASSGPAAGRFSRTGPWSDAGQTTAEYALVLLAAAAIALLLLAWAAGTDGIDRLFDAVIDSVIGKVA